ncbi:MAG: radical SAM protein, partial [Candidatus Micrarchaeota archaeon]
INLDKFYPQDATVEKLKKVFGGKRKACEALQTLFHPGKSCYRDIHFALLSLAQKKINNESLDELIKDFIKNLAFIETNEIIEPPLEDPVHVKEKVEEYVSIFKTAECIREEKKKMLNEGRLIRKKKKEILKKIEEQGSRSLRELAFFAVVCGAANENRRKMTTRFYRIFRKLFRECNLGANNTLMDLMNVRHAASLKNYFTLQWHVTAKCDQKCKHCYIYDKSYAPEIANELDIQNCLRVVDKFASFTKKLGVTPRISFIGGDPLLRKDFFDIANYAKSKGIEIVILGNPFHLTPENIRKIKKLGVQRYQLSIDGMQKMHDELRMNGSFNATVKGIEILKKAGIKVNVMFTLSKKNAKELLDVIELVAGLGVDEFDFSRMVPTGLGKNLRNFVFKPDEYKRFLKKVLEKYDELALRGAKIHFGFKENLWKPLLFELGRISIPKIRDSPLNQGGCSMALNYICLSGDGFVYACRRLNVKQENILDKSFEQIFFSGQFNKIRRTGNYECAGCALSKYCRGCPAFTRAVAGSQFLKDPCCWIKEGVK